MSDSKAEAKRDGCEMLQALYDFKATLAKTLSFHEKELFILYPTSKKQRQWWQVVNRKGQVGFIPSNYINKIQVPPSQILEFVSACEKILAEERKSSGDSVSHDRIDLAKHLSSIRKQAEEIQQTSTSHKHGPPPPADFSPDRGNSPATTPHSVPCGAVPAIGGPAALLKFGQSKYSASAGNKTKTPSPVVPRRHSSLDECGRRSQQSNNAFHDNPANGVASSADSLSTSVSQSDSILETCWPSVDGIQAYQILQEVRKHTSLSHDHSRIAVSVVLSELQRILGSATCPPVDNLLNLVSRTVPTPHAVLESSLDSRRLHLALSELTKCKDDQQQRSWALYEDQSIISEYLEEIASILTNADPNICRHVLSLDQYQYVVNIALYYQMETRWELRSRVLKVLQAMCVLDGHIVSILLASVLPMELARDMRSSACNNARLVQSASLLTTIYSMGEAMPVPHLEHVGRDFLSFLFAILEGENVKEMEQSIRGESAADLLLANRRYSMEQVSEAFFKLILAYNLQWRPGTNHENLPNETIEALSQRSTAKLFLEKLLLLVNREEDPVRTLDHLPVPPHAVLKMIIDVLLKPETAALLYTNDTRVLLDISLRRLADLPPGDQRRRVYLEMCRLVLRNTPYSEHEHRREDLLKCFTRIFCEETEASHPDQMLVREISNEFPNYFKR
ncbi:NCK-interacting protein with SH3 domain [Frankliniella fusca]|uniref:NCK-interacting protein with SH3 domain n=1 Tax=Frankliniella fusca TaxID=407009 RepID=A0AAE1LPL3_9NEOP|nr:NCK-interacting protein with SH3 domain [Frankliniella fusca]